MNELALFAGAGGGLLASRMLGWRTVCAVEWDDYARNALVARQNDRSLEAFPIWSDVQTFDGRPWRGIVDVISGGFPCQDISAAGKGAGIDGERSGMWGQMARIISEVRPGIVFVENSPMLTSRGLGRVLGDLAEMGFDAKWGVMGASYCGLQHRRERIWIVADSDKRTFWSLEQCKAKNIKQRNTEKWRENWIDFLVAHDRNASPSWRTRRQNAEIRPILRRDVDGLAYELERVATIGDGQSPIVAATAFKILSEKW